MIHSPRSISDAVQVLQVDPDAQILSGGTDFMVEVNFGHRAPKSILSLRAIKELRTWTQQDGMIRIGSALPYAQMETGPLAKLLPALAQAARTVGSPQIRAAGTLGGNLGTSSPAGDSLPVLYALDATIIIATSTGERRVAVKDFMVGPKRNSLAKGEIITAVEFPAITGYQGYSKVGVRNAMVISIASACLVHHPLERSVRVAMGTVGPTIIRASETEQWLAAECDLSSTSNITPAICTEFGRRCGEESRPITDHRSTAEYRRHAVSVITSRLLERCAAS